MSTPEPDTQPANDELPLTDVLVDATEPDTEPGDDESTDEAAPPKRHEDADPDSQELDPDAPGAALVDPSVEQAEPNEPA